MNGRKRFDWISFLIGFLMIVMLIFTFAKLARSENRAEDIKNEKNFGKLIAGEWQSKSQKDEEISIFKMVFYPKINEKKEIMPKGKVISSKNITTANLSLPRKLFYRIKNDVIILFLSNRTEYGRVKIINLNEKTMKLIEIDNSNGESIQEALTFEKKYY